MRYWKLYEIEGVWRLLLGDNMCRVGDSAADQDPACWNLDFKSTY